MVKQLSDFFAFSDGVKMPVLGFGVYKSPVYHKDKHNSVEEALKAGYRHIDTAQLYKNEVKVGQAVREFGYQTLGLQRRDIFVTTKIRTVPSDGDIIKSIEKSISDIGLEYVDFFLVHTSSVGPKDRAAIWKALEEVKNKNLIRSIGVSNYGVKHLEELASISSIKPAVNQIELHPWLQQRPIVEYCQKHNIVVEAYCPLARAQRMDNPTLQRISQEVQRDPGQVLLRWSLQKGYSPLPKSDNPLRIKSNAALYDFMLTVHQMDMLDELDGKRGAVSFNTVDCD